MGPAVQGTRGDDGPHKSSNLRGVDACNSSLAFARPVVRLWERSVVLFSQDRYAESRQCGENALRLVRKKRKSDSERSTNEINERTNSFGALLLECNVCISSWFESQSKNGLDATASCASKILRRLKDDCVDGGGASMLISADEELQCGLNAAGSCAAVLMRASSSSKARLIAAEGLRVVAQATGAIQRWQLLTIDTLTLQLISSPISTHICQRIACIYCAASLAHPNISTAKVSSLELIVRKLTQVWKGDDVDGKMRCLLLLAIIEAIDGRLQACASTLEEYLSLVGCTPSTYATLCGNDTLKVQCSAAWLLSRALGERRTTACAWAF